MSHTSAPWDWREGQSDIVRKWDGREWVVASVNSNLSWHEDAQCASREAGSNARLIAAAPELLEALKAFDAVIKHQYSGTREAMGDLTLAAQMAQAAIAKAEGTK